MRRDSSLWSKFLAVERWRYFFRRLVDEIDTRVGADRGFFQIIVALMLCCVGPTTAAVEIFYKMDSTTKSTIVIGVSTALAILYRSTIRREQNAVPWRESLSLTHTAFALGCIPALLVVAIDPSLLARRGHLLSNSLTGGQVETSWIILIPYIALFAIWAAVTEEYLFRGLLISVIRRSKLSEGPRVKTVIACSISSVLFGIAHYPLWGAGASLALTGIGLGLALGYVANGERIWPLIVYHCGFDFLSMSVALLS